MLIQWNYVWDSSLRPQIQKKERCCRLAHFFSKNAPQFCHLGDPGVPTRCGWLGVGWPHPHSLWTQPFPVKRACKINHKVLQWSTGSRQVHALTHFFKSRLFLRGYGHEVFFAGDITSRDSCVYWFLGDCLILVVFLIICSWAKSRAAGLHPSWSVFHTEFADKVQVSELMVQDSRMPKSRSLSFKILLGQCLGFRAHIDLECAAR